MGLIDAVRKATQPIVVDLPFNLDDGEPAAVKCRPLVVKDYLSVESTKYGKALPILTGMKDEENMSLEERIDMYGWFCEIVKKSTISIRDIDNGIPVWRPIRWVEDGSIEQVTLEGQDILMTLTLFERINGGSVNPVAMKIIERSNDSGEMESAKRGVQ